MMKTMKMQFKYLCVAALALVGALTTGCSNDEPDLDVAMPPAVSDSVSLNTPLTLEAREAGAKVTFTFSEYKASGDVEYSTDGTSWSTYTGGTAITLNSAGDKVMFRGNCQTYDQCNISCDKDCYIYGNVMSLISSTGFATATELTEGDTFKDLFKGNEHIVNHDSKPLSLPATKLTRSCYAHMFEGCDNLKTAPVLPATKLADNCYESMFKACNNLNTAPDLPATKLADNCYAYMFNGCNNLTTAPALPATELANNCYESMFNGCSSLETAPVLPATKLVVNCYQYMFQDCDRLETAPVLPATTLADMCYRSMFQSCDNLKTAPVLPATKLTDNCYYEMFCFCYNLSSVTCLATDITANCCLLDWLEEAGGDVFDEKTLHVRSGQPTDKSYWHVHDDWTVVADQ